MEIESLPAAPATTTTAATATAGNVGWIFAVVSIVLIPFAIFGLVNAVPWVAKPRVQLQKIRVNGSRSDPFGPSSRVTATFILSNTNWVCLKYDLLSTSLVYNGITFANDMKPRFSQQKGGRDYVDCEFTTIYTFGRSSRSLSVRAVLTAYYRESGFPRFLVGDFYHDLRISCDVVIAQDPRHPTIFTASSPRCKIV